MDECVEAELLGLFEWDDSDVRVLLVLVFVELLVLVFAVLLVLMFAV